MTGPTSFDDRYNEPDQLRDQVRRLLRYRAIIALGAALGLLCGVLLALLRVDQYISTGEVVVRSTADPFSNISVSIDHQLSMPTERQVALSATVADRAAKTLGEPAARTDALQSSLRVVNPPDTQVLRFQYTAGSPKRAARAANAFVEAYLADRKDRTDAKVERMTRALDEQILTLRKQSATTKGPTRSGVETQIASLQKRLSDLETRDTSGGDVVRGAEPPAHPAGPGQVVIVGLGLLGGLTIGIMLAWLRAVLEPRVRSVADMQSSLRAPVIGILPGATEDDELLTVGRNHNRLTEAYRTLAFRLTHDERSAGRHSLLVLAPREHPNTEAVAVNLCAAIAEIGHDVVLVDATGSAPALASRLPILPDSADSVVDAGRAGRFSIVSGNSELDTSGSPAPRGATHILPSNFPAASVVVLARAMLEQADGLALAQRVDGVLVVGGLNSTRRDDLRRVHELIVCAGGRIAGAVLDTGVRGGRLSTALDGARHRRKKYRGRIPMFRPDPEHHAESPLTEKDETLTASQG
ncbi:hypothetical protein [Streptomyces sp. NPDC051219]|uniref:hypothetical protein n=1 Tax=Streptomyces sp. NPDC051219 TaxID=3155283 RepID=UPI0034128EA3